MTNLLIKYPKLFNSYDKFSRKVSRIIQNMEDFCVTVYEDENGFIAKFFKENHPDVGLVLENSKNISKITHAIYFDDGEEYSSEIKQLKSSEVNIRAIKISITRVTNIKTDTRFQGKKCTPVYEYIGRESYWGNPYSMYGGGDDRAEVIRKFKYDFDFDKFTNKEKSEVYKLAGKRLGCFCKPQDCHGDILANFLNSWDDGE